MRRKITKWLLVAASLLLGAPTYGQDTHIMWECASSGFNRFCYPSATNPLPVTGTFTPSAASPEFTPVAPATATATKGVLLGTQYNSTQATFTDGQQGSLQSSSRGALFVAVGADGFGVTQGTSPWVVGGNGTAGTAAAGVLSIQGIASMTPIQVSQATAASLNATIVGTGTFTTQSAVTAASGAYASGSLASGAMVDLVALSAPVAPATATATKSVLLGAQATTAAVNPTTGQQSALSSDTNNNLLTSPGGAPNVTTSQVTVTTSSTSVCPVRALRRSCAVSTITGTQQVFCSGTTATTSNGQIFPAVIGASFPFQTTAAVNCIAVSSSQVVSVVETF